MSCHTHSKGGKKRKSPWFQGLFRLQLPDQGENSCKNKLENDRFAEIGAESDAIGTIPIDVLRIVELWEKLSPANQRAVMEYAEQLARGNREMGDFDLAQ